MSEQCTKQVSGDWHSRQCSRKATKDGYCKQHHPDAVAKRRKESERLYEEKEKQTNWYKLGQSRKEVAELKARAAELEKSLLEYLESEGCSCCRDDEKHRKALEKIGSFFGWSLFSDGSGVDWYARRDELKKEAES